MDCKNCIRYYNNRYHGDNIYNMKIINLQNITTVLWLALMAYIAYTLFYHIKTMTVESMTVINSPVQAGETMLYKMKYCKYTDVPTIVYRTFYWPNGYIAPSPSIMSTTTPWCKESVMPIQTYTTMPPWLYYIRSNVEFKISAFRTEYINAESDMFEIIPHK